jgi:ABC-type Fe3+-siderophore transport system permease subunit
MIINGYATYLEAYDIEQSMTADLGVICPEAPGYSCPTEAFKSAGNNFTLVSLIHSYRENITDTAHDLVNLASTSVGDTMDQVQDFLCNMNVSFVADRYDQVEAAVCGSLFGGFAQVNWALWFLAILLELMSILALVLSTRLQGCSTDKLIGFKIESELIDDMDVQQ